MLEKLKPEYVVPLVAYLCHESAEESGSVFEGGAGYFAKLRWQRSKGAVFKTDDTFTPAAVKARWDEVNNFKESTYPAAITDTDYLVSLPVHSVALGHSLIDRVNAGLPRGVKEDQNQQAA